MTPAQCRAARALLDWSQQSLADASGVGNATIRNIEAGRSEPTRSTVAAMRATLEAAGVIFVEENGEGPGVRLRRQKPRPTDGSMPEYEDDPDEADRILGIGRQPKSWK